MTVLFDMLWWVGIAAGSLAIVYSVTYIGGVIHEMRRWRDDRPNLDEPADLFTLYHLGWAPTTEVIEDTIDRWINHVLGEATPERAEQ